MQNSTKCPDSPAVQPYPAVMLFLSCRQSLNSHVAGNKSSLKKMSSGQEAVLCSPRLRDEGGGGWGRRPSGGWHSGVIWRISSCEPRGSLRNMNLWLSQTPWPVFPYQGLWCPCCHFWAICAGGISNRLSPQRGLLGSSEHSLCQYQQPQQPHANGNHHLEEWNHLLPCL